MCEDKYCGPARGRKEAYMPYMECNSMTGHRHFLSRDEKAEMLEKYVEELEKEIKGVKQKIQEIKS